MSCDWARLEEAARVTRERAVCLDLARPSVVYDLAVEAARYAFRALRG